MNKFVIFAVLALALVPTASSCRETGPTGGKPVPTFATKTLPAEHTTYPKLAIVLGTHDHTQINCQVSMHAYNHEGKPVNITTDSGKTGMGQIFAREVAPESVPIHIVTPGVYYIKLDITAVLEAGQILEAYVIMDGRQVPGTYLVVRNPADNKYFKAVKMSMPPVYVGA